MKEMIIYIFGKSNYKNKNKNKIKVIRIFNLLVKKHQQPFHTTT